MTPKQMAQTWTVERFRELISSEKYEVFYESRWQIERLSEHGADLMNFVVENKCELTPGFRKYHVGFYFKHRLVRSPLVFGINLHSKYQGSRLFVSLPEDTVIDMEDDWIDSGIMNHRHEEYYSQFQHAVYPRGVKVADIEQMLLLAYAWRSGA